jgi:hypothetical protein
MTSDSSGSGDWVRNLGDSRNVYLYNKFGKGTKVRTQFSNDLTTPVSVQVTGNWASN